MVSGNGVRGIAVGVNTVGGIVRVGLPLPGRQVVVDALGQVPGCGHGSKIDHRRRTTPDGPPGECSSGPALGTPATSVRAPGWTLATAWAWVSMPPGNHDLATGVDDLVRLGREHARKGHGDDLLAHDPYVPVPDPSRGDYASSLNEHIQHDAPPNFSSSLWKATPAWAMPYATRQGPWTLHLLPDEIGDAPPRSSWSSHWCSPGCSRASSKRPPPVNCPNHARVQTDPPRPSGLRLAPFCTYRRCVARW